MYFGLVLYMCLHNSISLTYVADTSTLSLPIYMCVCVCVCVCVILVFLKLCNLNFSACYKVCNIHGLGVVLKTRRTIFV